MSRLRASTDSLRRSVAARESRKKRTGTAENSVGDRHEPRRLFVLTCTGAELPSQPVDLRIEVLDSIEQKGAQLTDRSRQPRTWILEGRCQPIDTSRAVRRDDAELRQVGPATG